MLVAASGIVSFSPQPIEVVSKAMINKTYLAIRKSYLLGKK
jgi:hypothetical protein